MKSRTKSIILFILDLLIITSSFLFALWLKPATRTVYLSSYLIPFVGFSILWIFLSLLLGKYNIKYKYSLKQFLSPIYKTAILSLLLILLLIFLLKLLHYSRLIVIGTIVCAAMIELFLGIILFYHRKIKGEFDLPSKFTHKTTPVDNEYVDSDKTILEFKDLDDPVKSIKVQLKDRYLNTNLELYKLLSKSSNLNGIHIDKTLVLKTHTIYNIEDIEKDSQQLFINLHKINDIRRINKFFIQVSQNLQYGGYFVCSAQTIDERYKIFKKKYPPILFHVFYAFNFIITRVFPKLPIFKEIFFALSKGANRPISKAEVLGRLSFCGFRICAYESINNVFYVISQKYSSPREDKSPTYGPLIKLKRYGMNGHEIFVYKFRTMHPYSEYLHDLVLDKHGYNEMGKAANDMRITSWGKVFRKLWLDEIPQIINWLKGDIALIGVRPLSKRFLREYPEDLIEIRFKYKPGCIPPYVAYNKQAVDEYIESERKYFAEKRKHPIITDFRIFFMAFRNIITGKIRSE